MRIRVLPVISAIFLMVFLLPSTIVFAGTNSTEIAKSTPSIKYQTYVENIGWQNPVKDGQSTGIEARKIEAIKIELENVPESDGGVEYTAHVQGYGWLTGDKIAKNGQMSGTIGENKQLEAIKIKLTGKIAQDYDVYYRVYAADYGWLGWAKNGAEAGSEGLAKRLELIEIKLVKKEDQVSDTTPPFIKKIDVSYRTHVQDYGWLRTVSNGAMSGTEGEAKRLEAIEISLSGDKPISGDIVYQTHVQDYGWLNEVKNGQPSGTTRESKRLEAIKISLTGDIAKYFDVYYRIHVQDYGWLGWAKNGEEAGTEGLAKRLEAIEIKVVEKGGKVPQSSIRPYVKKMNIYYQTHVQDYGWLNPVSNGALSGTEGKAKRLEGIKISISDNPTPGDIVYQTHVQDYGWLEEAKNGEFSGTTGESKRLEAIKISLTSEIANYYDVYYRVHVQDYGWLGWAKNGEEAGTSGLAKRLEAIEIKVVEKGGKVPRSTNHPYIKKMDIYYQTHVQDYGWLNPVSNGAISGTQGKAKRLEGIKIDLEKTPLSGNIVYQTHVQDYGWLNEVVNGQLSGTTGKAKRLEAIKISLTGEIAKYFDVYYRVHIQDYGWLGWAKNGMPAGSEGQGKRLEAIEIRLYGKGLGPSVDSRKAFIQPITIFLDPGHGGNDAGAVSNGVKEKDINLDIALKVRSYLQKMGYKVVMSRETDKTVELYDRPKMANEVNADILVSIHTNSAPGASRGIENYYYQYKPEYPPKVNHNMHNNSLRVANSIRLTNIIHQKMIAYTGAPDRKTRGASFVVLRESEMPATLLEVGFINNPTERRKLTTNSYRDTLARAIADGINEYFK